MIIEDLFPTPVARENINMPTESETDFLLGNKEIKNNIGNKRGVDSYLLENSLLKNLKNTLQKKLEQYFITIYQNKEVKPYITQSWINYTDKDEYHHAHNHANSFISGVYYLKTIEEDKIVFYKETTPMFDILSHEYNRYNSQSWWLPVTDGDLIFFPSTLKHEVYINETDETRISIAFNCFIKGTLGNKVDLTELKL